MAIDLNTLWNFGDPAQSEARFREALGSASPDEALILQTQIARTYGIRKDFATAQRLLAELEPQLSAASAEPQVRYWLERGRSLSSATHSPESQTDAVRAQAREAFLQAFALAKDAALDYLAVDALHMMAFVDTTPEEQLQWDLKALAYLEASEQAETKKWEGSLRHNVGYALHLQGRYDDALAQFSLSREARRRDGNENGGRVAIWMIAWTYRAQGRLSEALELQHALETEWDSIGEPDPYVFEELEILYRALGEEDKAAHYAQRLAKTRGS